MASLKSIVESDPTIPYPLQVPPLPTGRVLLQHQEAPTTHSIAPYMNSFASNPLIDHPFSSPCRICKDNMDKSFGDCSIPQEKSNADINEELELSEATGHKSCDWANGMSPNSQAKEAKSEGYKVEIVGAAAASGLPLSDVAAEARHACGVVGTMGVALSVCTLPGQPKSHHLGPGKMELGLGIHEEPGVVVEDIQPVDLLVSHVLNRILSSVLDMPTYEASQKEYARKGHKHFYFMTLNGSESRKVDLVTIYMEADEGDNYTHIPVRNRVG
ncbi:unnamed protein product [Lactuca saligna]|uniref:DhaK domain-containing protein n=1 Tax=Lactuca saligna TaxID=75948 RepID=A0AA36E9C7_LACSI|nr:unnamed protein product [Lactuca saligna]